ncbi:MAG: uroporphyrinogen-III C-methyltransferase [Desulfuromonadales bacterium]|nr:uroporphyrinogen-III C-methyltransferase [Desulfuromonadales bacterium]
MQKAGKQGIVYLIGAGPGDPGLITVRGLQCLRQAQVVIYDHLANPELLGEAPQAEHLYVGKQCGCHYRPQEEIHLLLAEHAGQGKVVARLKGGDPFVFGRGGEEAQFLETAGIPFEVVPGVTAALAAAAYAGIPLTHRGDIASLTLVTGHEDPAKEDSGLNWPSLANAGTLVFYMGMTNLPAIADRLLAHGRPPGTPVAVVRWATTCRQQTLVAPLAQIAARAQEAGLRPPAVIIIGEVVARRSGLSWFERRPLFGRRILVTRTAEQAGAFTSLLQSLGAEAVACPLIAIVPPEDWQEVDAELDRLPETDFLILTSTNAVELFFGRLRQRGGDARDLHRLQVVAVGPKTASAIEAEGIRPDLVPTQTEAEGVVELLAPLVAGKRVLYPRAALSRELICRELTAAGARVAVPVLYRTVPPPGGGEQLQAILAQGVDAVTFTSSSTVENFVALAGPDHLQRLAATPLLSIGAQTSRTLRRLGLPVAAEARETTLEAMAQALIDYFHGGNDVFP